MAHLDASSSSSPSSSFSFNGDIGNDSSTTLNAEMNDLLSKAAHWALDDRYPSSNQMNRSSTPTFSESDERIMRGYVEYLLDAITDDLMQRLGLTEPTQIGDSHSEISSSGEPVTSP